MMLGHTNPISPSPNGVAPSRGEEQRIADGKHLSLAGLHEHCQMACLTLALRSLEQGLSRDMQRARASAVRQHPGESELFLIDLAFLFRAKSESVVIT
jgi:hypothetical protein